VTQVNVAVEKPPIYLIVFGERVELHAEGVATAGVDLAELRAEDVRVRDDYRRVEITLPPSRMFDHFLDEQATRVGQHDISLIARVDPSVAESARTLALADVQRIACDAGLLRDAAAEAEQRIAGLLRLLGFVEIVVRGTAGSCAQ
jgi:hypothetical protein